ncbi:MAG: FtsW/RodA/SpoVE family cell cycle protein, partial [Acidobacteriota bacterium]|nr:FtsW/RodA/SpoVE family cell cycle protein [Acidobacteriota bacterium]
RAAGRAGDPVLLPAALLLTGLSAAAMISMRDPLRDTDAATSLVYGVAAGCALLTALAFVDFENPRLKRSTALPLAAAVLLSAALLIFGSGPGQSGAKVNLLGVQPIEAIRLLAVLALASYFGRRWELLREIASPAGPSPAIRRRVTLPRLRDVQPLAIIVGTLLVFFVLQKDLGPALVLGSIALGLYGVARARAGLVVAGFAVLAAGFAAGYWIGIPSTVARRVSIWLAPWHNGLVGGDQIAHAQWALASGGAWGLGGGLGEGQLIPAGHTDLIVAVLGEELGFAGLIAIAAILAIAVWRILKIAERAPGDYTAFLALGCALSLAVPAFVIVGGLLGLMPLTGVVTPFLSYGKSSMIANMAAIAIPLAIARRTGRVRPSFQRQIHTAQLVLIAGVAIIAGRAAWLQIVRADATTLRPSLVRQADGGARFQYNPRLLLAARLIPRGTIFDRNGLPVAANDTAGAAPTLQRLAALGAGSATACPASAPRCYPLGSAAFHLIGDAARETNWAAPNTSFVERDAASSLQGFDDHPRTLRLRMANGETATVIARDYSELLPLVRGKGYAAHPDVRRILDRNRDVRITIDAPLQALVARALEARARGGSGRGAAVVIDAGTGALLASATYPWPEAGGYAQLDRGATPEQLLDRARYGLYPPGSTFKLITAAAALSTTAPALLPSFQCERLADGRVGANVPGVGRPIRDDVLDRVPHGHVDLRRGIVVSCNAYFAQLAMLVGPGPIDAMARTAGIQAASDPALANLRRTLPFAGYGQGEVVASPLRMARAVAAIAGTGSLREAPLVQTGGQTGTVVPWLKASDAAMLRSAMRDVVVSGTGRALAGHPAAIAGKTGTAEVGGAPSHSWFVGFAPSGSEGTRIAFAVVLENAGYGGRAAASLAGDIVTAARTSGIIR